MDLDAVGVVDGGKGSMMRRFLVMLMMVVILFIVGCVCRGSCWRCW